MKLKHIVLQNMVHGANKFFNCRAIGGGSIVKKMMEGSVEVGMGDIGVQYHYFQCHEQCVVVEWTVVEVPVL